jgi:hypothetical protein
MNAAFGKRGLPYHQTFRNDLDGNRPVSLSY